MMFILILCLYFVKANCFTSDVTINISDKKCGDFPHFWTSTGLCPPDPKENIPHFLLSNEEKLNIALIGSLPNYGIKYVRIHWLLNLLTSLRNKTLDNSYNFTNLDLFLSYLHEYELYPGLEIMGYPNKMVHFEENGQFWKDLVETMVRRYIVKFGAKTVSKWRFETWNEPDLRGYNAMNFTVAGYLNYVIACSQGLKNAFRHTNLTGKLGGPAGLFKDEGHPLCWALLETCAAPVADGCPVHFISFHKKGDGSAEGVLNGTFALLDTIRNKYPELREIPVANDEADIEQNWAKSLEWRADVRYAAMVVKVIAGYYKSLRQNRKLKIELLSNDNAFLNYHPFYFTQRTLFARFQMNNTEPQHDQFIKKPVYSLMALLSFLGNEILQEKPARHDPLLTTIPTRCKQGKRKFVSVILAYANETTLDASAEKVVNVALKGLEGGIWKFLVYRLDNINTNPYDVWKELGKPVFPGVDQRKMMRDVEEPQRFINPTDVNQSYLNLTLTLTIPSIYLIHLCEKPNKVPRKVLSVRIVNITWNEVLITWKNKNKFSKCLRTYEVEFQSKCSVAPHFKRINPHDTIFESFHHVGEGDGNCEWTRGRYRVRAVDYWDRTGKFSEIISYP